MICGISVVGLGLVLVRLCLLYYLLWSDLLELTA